MIIASCCSPHMGPKLPCWNCCLMVSSVAGVGCRSPLPDSVRNEKTTKCAQKKVEKYGHPCRLHITIDH